MTEEEYFRKHYPDYCYGESLLSPYWDFFQYGVEFGERQSEKKIKELEKENEKLDKQIDTMLEDCKRCTYRKTSEQLEQAKKIIKGLLSCCGNYPQENAEKMKQAEQFLQEIEK